MKNMITDYSKEIKELANKNIKNKEEVLSDLLVHIEFFQHERLIHLIVTFLVGIAAVLFFGLALYFENLGICLLVGITVILFTLYIIHYYFLENSVQKLYEYYDQIKNKE